MFQPFVSGPKSNERMSYRLGIVGQVLLNTLTSSVRFPGTVQVTESKLMR